MNSLVVSLKDKIDQLLKDVRNCLDNVQNTQDVDHVKNHFLGKKGLLTQLLKDLKNMDPSERASVGQLINSSKNVVEQWIQEIYEKINQQKLDEQLQKEKIDVSLPAYRSTLGKLHPLTLVEEELIDIFSSLGFDVEEGPDIEDEYYNFSALNIPQSHPARDMQDTFFIKTPYLLRTHTSPVQIRTMEKYPPPIKIIAPGSVYRNDADVTHSPMFHQIEGLYVDTGNRVHFGHLKFTLEKFIKKLFGAQSRMRMRPSFFPFTEPSAEVDVSCVICLGKGCRVCSHTGWLEILGAGMVNPKVFQFIDHYRDRDDISGFAFGLGVERIAMLKYGIDDIRLFYENDDRFLRQF